MSKEITTSWPDGLADYEANMLSFGRKYAADMIANQDVEPADVPLGACYYDAALVFYNIADYTKDDSFLAAAEAANHVYRDRYIVPNNGGAAGHWMFPRGLARHYHRTGDVKSKDALILLSQNGAGAGDGFPVRYAYDVAGSREAAYALMVYMMAEDCGAAHRTRADEMLEILLGHVEQWTHPDPRPLRLYVRPFMVGLTCDSLIEWHARTGDARIPPAVGKILEWIWTHCWQPEYQGFTYTDIETNSFVDVAKGTVAAVESPGVFSGDPGLSPVDGFYPGGQELPTLTFRSGALSGQSFNVSAYTGSDRKFTLAPAPGTAPAVGDTFDVPYRIAVFGTVATAGTDTVFTADSSMSEVTDIYNHSEIQFITGARAGLSQMVDKYDGPSRTMTISDYWTHPPGPAAGDRFLIRAPTGPTGGRESGAGLNLLIAPAFTWMYTKTGDTSWRDRADAIFAGGVANGWNGAPKQFNQNYKWSFEHIKMRSDSGVPDPKPPAPDGGPSPGPTPGPDKPPAPDGSASDLVARLTELADRVARLESWRDDVRAAVAR